MKTLAANEAGSGFRIACELVVLRSVPKGQREIFGHFRIKSILHFALVANSSLKRKGHCVFSIPMFSFYFFQTESLQQLIFVLLI